MGTYAYNYYQDKENGGTKKMNDKMIEKLESKGFKRWTKGNMDRLYINAQYLGYEPETATAMPKLNGESVSRSEARRIVNAKTYIDLKDDTLHNDGYWNDSLKDAAQVLIDEAAAEIEAEEKAEAEQAQAMKETEAAEAPEVVIEKENEMENKKWYAVQEQSSDEWDNGSFDFEEAKAMLKKQGYGLIAVIVDDFCEEEIAYNDLY